MKQNLTVIHIHGLIPSMSLELKWRKTLLVYYCHQTTKRLSYCHLAPPCQIISLHIKHMASLQIVFSHFIVCLQHFLRSLKLLRFFCIVYWRKLIKLSVLWATSFFTLTKISSNGFSLVGKWWSKNDVAIFS